MSIGLLEIGAVVGGFVLLVWGADRFVLGASGLARILGVSPLIIGLVVVGFGTSAPEMLVSSLAALEGNPALGVGNALGSNITNVGLVLGVTALVAPLTVKSDVLRREFPLLFVLMIVVTFMLLDRELSRIEGALLLAGLVAFVSWMVHLARQSRHADPLEAEFEHELPEPMPLGSALFWLIVGLAVLLGGAKLVVWGAVKIALAFGVSDLVIGLTIVAIGTSLPELFASIVSARRNEHDIAIGNIIGSNVFNLLGVLGLPALIHPALLESEVITRDYPIMFFLTLLLFLMAKGVMSTKHVVSRLNGAALTILFFAYLGILFVMST